MPVGEPPKFRRYRATRRIRARSVSGVVVVLEEGEVFDFNGYDLRDRAGRITPCPALLGPLGAGWIVNAS